MALVLDTGPLYASLDVRDSAHAEARALILEASESLVIPAPVLVEVDYLLARAGRPDVFLLLLDDILDGAYEVADLHPDEHGRVREICGRYADADIGYVDAAVLTIVERLEETKLATLDRRHFGMMRPRHVESLLLLPG